MTEDEARGWVESHWPSDRVAKLDTYCELLKIEASRQNLIARSTIDQIWSRHIADSAQLLTLAERPVNLWVDIGSGAGLPGIVIAILSDAHSILVEPRRLRAKFLETCINRLDLGARTSVAMTTAESYTVANTASVISARAVGKATSLIAAGQHFSDRHTWWLLPKGRSAQSEVEAAQQTWQGVFHVEQSIVDPQSGIIVAHQVMRR